MPFRKRALATLLVLFFFVASGLLGACGDSHAQDAHDGEGAAQTAVASGDAITLSDAARSFIGVEEISLSEGVTALRAPARVAFRDGAVAEISSPVAGRIATVHVTIGDRVESGAPLATLRSPDAAAARAQLSSAHAALESALTEARRTQDMLERGVSTERERRSAELRVAELEIEMARARTAVSIVGRGSGGDVVLRAPISGVVLARRATPGMAVEAGGAALIEIGDPDAVWVIADVFDRDAALVRVGAPVTVVLPSFDDPLVGNVAQVGQTVAEGTRTVPVRVEFDVVPPGMRAGLFGRASIGLLDEGLSLPASAVLVRDGETTIVFVEDADGAFRRRPVLVGPSVDGRVHVRRGLEAGERVVTRGALLLDGAADQLI